MNQWHAHVLFMSFVCEKIQSVHSVRSDKLHIKILERKRKQDVLQYVDITMVANSKTNGFGDKRI